MQKGSPRKDMLHERVLKSLYLWSSAWSSNHSKCAIDYCNMCLQLV